MVNKYINATYQEIYDLATSPSKVTIIGIRTPSGSVPSTMLAGLWKQFKSVKYSGCDIVMRATARQPLDPLQVGNSAGTQMDMRDMQNPILFRGCHGESLGSILNDLMGSSSHTFSGDSLDIDETNLNDVENFYYQCLTDMSWKKSMPENGFAFNGLHPLVNRLAANYQLNDAGAGIVDIGQTHYINIPGSTPTVGEGYQYSALNTGLQIKSDGSAVLDGNKRIFTHDLTPLGWLDTEDRIGGSATATQPNSRIPKVYMGMLMLPPAYTQGIRQFFRVVITHYFTFKDFRSISLDSNYSNTPGYYDTINTNGEVVLTSAKVR